MDNIPYGYCQCGCGRKTNIAPRNNTSKGWVEGEPLLYLRWHKPHIIQPLMTTSEHRCWWHEQAPDIPYGYCWCGCGSPTNIADSNKPQFGHFKNMPMRFRLGHWARDEPYPKHKYIVEDKGYETPCWIWQLGTDKDGYANSGAKGKTSRVHRMMYERVFGPIPKDKQIDHLCRVRSCINPAHLEAVTGAENVRRGNLTKLTAKDVAEIRRLYATGNYTQSRLAKEYKVRPSHISRIVARDVWKR